MDASMLRDVRFALQLLAKDRWYAAVAIAALSLGIGVNAAVFTLVDAVLIRGLPFKDSSQLYMLGSPKQPASEDASKEVSYRDLEDWRAGAPAFSGMAGFLTTSVNVSDDRVAAEQARATLVTPNAFSLLDEQPVVGRDFSDADARTGAEPVVILGYALWHSRYGGDPSIVGRTIRINGEPAAVIGVMPRNMMFPLTSQLWKPLVPTADELNRGTRDLDVFGRLAPGTTRGQAQAAMNAIAQRLAAQYPSTNTDFPLVTIETFNDRFNGGVARTVFLSMMGAVAFLLLIACANVANLLLSRSVQRAREIAVRMALGASRWRIVRQLLIESVLLGILGGAFGLAFAAAGVHLFGVAVENTGKPFWVVFTMDYRVFGFLAAVCLATGLLFGLAPALHVSRTNVNGVLKEGGRGNAGGRRALWISNAMVVVELALTMVLLVGAGLTVRSFLKAYTLDLGIRTDHLLTMRMLLPADKYPAARADELRATDTRLVFYQRLLGSIAAGPGVESAAITTSVPPYGSAHRALEVEGRPVRGAGEAAPSVSVVTISPAFFDAVGVQMRRGRPFGDRDGTPGNDTVIVNEQLAAHAFPGEDPIGRRITLANGSAARRSAPPEWRTIVGISPNIHHASQQDPQSPAVVYVPMRRDPPRAVTLLIRSPLEAGAIVGAIRRDVQTLDPDEPVFNVETMDQLLAQTRWPFRVFGGVFTIFAAIALLMAAVGLYAVLAYSVTQRKAEIGVRMALGAKPLDVSWLILKRALLQLAVGLTLGLGGALALSRVLRAFLVQISPTDPLTFVAITGVLIVVALGACLVPVRRATRVDPLIALRTE
jgi:putative ABC transport system permease protein